MTFIAEFVEAVARNCVEKLSTQRIVQRNTHGKCAMQLLIKISHYEVIESLIKGQHTVDPMAIIMEVGNIATALTVGLVRAAP